MGIRGLQTFINGRPNILERFELRNCNIVLDGNSIYHQIYTRTGLPCIFGGEYDDFYRYCIRLFELFRACNVKVVVIFDGTQLDDRKLETSLARAQDRINKSLSTNLGVELSPLLLRQVFLSVLDTLNIPYMSALGEGDGECVSLANHLDSFLVAQDSDYFCYDLIRGYIPFDSMVIDFFARISYIPVKLYRINSVLRAFPGLQYPTLILACCLCGNDYLSRNLTQPILNHLKNRVYMPQEIENNESIQTKYLYASMQWMRKFDHFHIALEQSCELINSIVRQIELQNKLRTIVRSYFIPSDTLIHQLTWSNNFNLPRESLLQRARTYSLERCMNNNLLNATSNGGQTIPEYLCTAVSNLCLSPSFIEILIHRRLICKAHIEVISESSIYEHAIPLIEPCFAILLRWDRVFNNPSVDIYQRNRDQLMATRYLLEHYTNHIPKLEHVRSLPIDQRQRFVRNYFNLLNNPFERWNDIDINYHFWLMIIRYWYTRRRPQPVFLYAMIVCLINTIFLKTEYEHPEVRQHITQILSAFGCSKNYLRNFSNIYQRVNAMCNIDFNTNPFKNSIVYELNCLQTIYLYSLKLNDFFNKPFSSLIHSHYFISGKLFYAFIHRYRDHDNLSNALRDLFSQETVLLNFANKLYRCIDF